MIVLDCSVVIGFVFEDERTPYTVAVKNYLENHTPLVPALFFYEIANVITMQERKGRWNKKECDDFIKYLSAIDIEMEYLENLRNLEAVSALARKHRLTGYDASYLYLASNRNLHLATQDKALAEAARREGVYFAGG